VESSTISTAPTQKCVKYPITLSRRTVDLVIRQILPRGNVQYVPRLAQGFESYTARQGAVRGLVRRSMSSHGSGALGGAMKMQVESESAS
jgi:hypothetical protein